MAKSQPKRVRVINDKKNGKDHIPGKGYQVPGSRAFAKGNPGRPKGTVNRSRITIREFIDSKIANEFDKWFEKLTAFERCQIIVKMMPYAYARLNAIQVEGIPQQTAPIQIESAAVSLSGVSDATLNDLIAQIDK